MNDDFSEESSNLADLAERPSLPPGPNHEERLAALRLAIDAGQNVLLLAGAELLRVLAEIPAVLNEVQIAALRELLERELVEFTRLCDRLNVRREHMVAARYVLCTALDEVASLAAWNIQGEQADSWATMALLPQFHGEREGGEVVFMLLGRMANAPQEHMPVLELIHHVLSLGFMGHYRMQADGHRQLEAIRHRLFTVVSGSREPVPRELSGRWRGAAAGRFKLLRSVPVWVSASVLGLALLAQFSWAKYQLMTSATVLEKRILDLRELQPDVTPVQGGPKALGLAQLLAEDVAKGLVSVEESDQRSVVVFKGDGMFASGKVVLGPVSQALVAKVGQALADVSGQVVVSGHTDNTPLSDPRGLNKALSTQRAEVVAQVLVGQGVVKERVQALGKGALEPVADNATPAGRSQNRRVVIEVIRSGN